MPKIEHIKAHKIVDSRGDWVIESQVTLDDGSVADQPVPDGASSGENEAIMIKAEKAIEIVTGPINDALVGLDPSDQKNIDQIMLDMDGTPNKSVLGGNSILSVSLASAKAVAVSRGVELYSYLSDMYYDKKPTSYSLPTPVFNIINGGKHAQNNLSFQEFMVIPSQQMPFDHALSMGVSIYHTLKDSLVENGYSTGVGDEGGFAPKDFTVEKALQFIKKAASKNYKVGEQVFFGMDVAAESFFNHDEYIISEQNLSLNQQDLLDFYKNLAQKFELIFIEDPYYENDHEGWKMFHSYFKDKLMVVADDLVVTNTKYLQAAIKDNLANAVIVKPNQVGTLTETLDFVKMAKLANMNLCVSHRSGDNAEDTFIADLAVAVGAQFMKAGAPARGERVVKYNRVLEIYEDLSRQGLVKSIV